MDGLNDKEVLIQRKKYGSNVISMGKRKGFFNLFIESFGDPIIKILLIALGIKIFFLMADFDWYETVGIVIAIIISSFISAISEYGSSCAFEKLMEETSRIECRVIRNGSVKSILIDDVVVGDILVIDSGDKIGADGVIVDGDIEVDESMMNGEANSVKKSIKDIVYRGCVVYRGHALVRVDKVGSQSYYGRMVGELSVVNDSSPLKEKLGHLAIIISRLGYIASFLVSVSYLFSKIVVENSFNLLLIKNTISDFSLMFAYLLHALTLCVTIIVVSVPEGLPMMITLVLSSNMKRMLKNNVLVRKMAGIEAAGSLNILFTDKTGTITCGKLDVVGFVLGNSNRYSDLNHVSVRYRQLFVDSLVYNNESYYDVSSGKAVGGNSTDKAIIDFVKVCKKNNVSIMSQTLFDSKSKYSRVVVMDKGKIFQYVKGAFEVIFPLCNRYLNEDGSMKLLQNDVLLDNIKKYTDMGIRVICVAYSEGQHYEMRDLILLGFILIRDDIREESFGGIVSIQNAGVNVVMITGDNKGTAVSIAREVGIIKSDDDIVIDSYDLNQMSDEEVMNVIPRLKVVFRAMPDDKSRLVMLSKKMNMVVGMTGDGVNDAIALKRADVGFSMGSGTEVAKEASDIVIMDDNILSIEKAILYGRTIFKNIRKFIIFQLTVNFCAVSISVIGPFIGIQTPVTVIQMLWINMVMDTLAGLAFSYEPPLLEYMKELPKKRNESIINSYMLNEILITGIYSSILCIIFLKSSFIRGLFRYSISNQYIMTAFFGLFIFISIFNSFNARTVRLNILQDIFKNKVFIFIILFIFIVQIFMIYYGGSLFRTVGLNFQEFMVMFICSFSVIPFDIMRKIIYKYKKNI